MNVFDTRVTGPMVYNAAATYTNDHNTGSTGFEIDARTQEKWGYANFTASFYQTNFASADQTTAFYVQPDPNQLMGFAPVKLTLNAKYKITNHLNVNPWLVYLSHRYTLSSSTEVDGSAVPLTTSSVPETLLTNIILNYQNLFIQNLDLSFGVYNIFNQSYVLATAYDFGRNPLTANPREAMASLNYSWHF